MVANCGCFSCCQTPEEKEREAKIEKKKDRLRSTRTYELIGSAIPVFIGASFASLSERIIEYWAEEEEGKGGTSIKDKEFILTLFYMVFTVTCGMVLAIFIFPNGEADGNAAAKSRSTYLSNVPVVGRVLATLRRLNLSDFAGSVVTENAGFATKNFFVSLILKGIFEGSGLLNAFLAFCGQVIVLTCFILFGDRLYAFFGCAKKDVEGIMSFHIDSCSLCIAYIAQVLIALCTMEWGFGGYIFGNSGMLFEWEDEENEGNNRGGIGLFTYGFIVTSLIAVWQLWNSRDTEVNAVPTDGNMSDSTRGENRNWDICQDRSGKATNNSISTHSFQITQQGQSVDINCDDDIKSGNNCLQKKLLRSSTSMPVSNNGEEETFYDRWREFANVIVGYTVGVIWFCSILSLAPSSTNKSVQLVFTMVIAAFVTRHVPRMLATSDYNAMLTEEKIRKHKRYLAFQRDLLMKKSSDLRSESTSTSTSSSVQGNIHKKEARGAGRTGAGGGAVQAKEKYIEDAIPRRIGSGAGLASPTTHSTSTTSSNGTTTPKSVVSVLAQPLSHVLADDIMEEGRAVEGMRGQNNDDADDDDDVEEVHACTCCCCCSCCFSCCPNICLFIDKIGYLLTKIGHQKGAIKRAAIRLAVGWTWENCVVQIGEMIDNAEENNEAADVFYHILLLLVTVIIGVYLFYKSEEWKEDLAAKIVKESEEEAATAAAATAAKQQTVVVVSAAAEMSI